MAVRAGKHTTNYENTLIATSDDVGTDRGIVPPRKEENPSIAWRTWSMIDSAPYRYTSDDVIFSVWAERKGVPEDQRAVARTEFFSKGQACLRASDLGKKYGWGVHSDAEGRIALYGMETEAYRQLMDNPDVAKTKSMKRSRSRS